MKKAVILIAALLVISTLAFAEAPKTELKVQEFTGDASVTWGIDVDTLSTAFTNAAAAHLNIELGGAGDKSTTGENVWGEIKIKVDGDPLRILMNDSAAPTENDAGNVIVDVAKLHLGTVAYIGIKADGTQINYVNLPDTGAAVYIVDNAAHYGQVTGTTIIGNNSGALVAKNAPYGIVFGVSLPNALNLDLDIRSINQLDQSGTGLTSELAADAKNEYAFRLKSAVTAVANLTLEAGLSFYNDFTPVTNTTADMQFAAGLMAAYKLSLGDKLYFKPKAGVNIEYTNASVATGATAVTTFGYIANVSVLLGWGDRMKPGAFGFTPEAEVDPSGYYPGVGVGVQISDGAGAPGLIQADPEKPAVGFNLGIFSGSIVENLTADAAFEIKDVLATAMIMGATVNAKYAIKSGAMTLTPLLGFYVKMDSTTGLSNDEKTDAYLKLALEIAQIFPNTTLSFNYNSNDIIGGIANGAQNDMGGMVSSTLKIAF